MLFEIKIPLAFAIYLLPATLIVQVPLAGPAVASRIRSEARQIPADLAIIGDIVRPHKFLKE
jgi:hypothetical protein